jgi:hypothetical protein
MAECFCGCGLRVRFGNKRLSERGQQVREVVDALEGVSLPLVSSSPEHREKIERLIAHGRQYEAMLAGVIHGDVRPPDMAAQRQFFAWWEAADGIATAHLDRLRKYVQADERKRQDEEAIKARKRAMKEALAEHRLGRPLTDEYRRLMDFDEKLIAEALREARRRDGEQQ